MTNTNKAYPPVVVVDENDNEIGSAQLAEVWQKGLYHRIVSIYVEDEQGRMLLQLRGPQMKIYPNCWDQAAGGHVDKGHSYEQAAAIEVAEELGLSNVTLKTLGTFRSNNQLNDGRIINQFERVYLVRVSDSIQLRPELQEVAKLSWFTLPELRTQIARDPEKFTPGLLHGLREYFSLDLSAQ